MPRGTGAVLSRVALLENLVNDETDHYEFFRPSRVITPEKKLILAILNDAIETIRHPTKAEREDKGKVGARVLSDTIRWVKEENWDWPFSFVCVCSVLGLDPRAVRKVLLRDYH